MKRLVTFDALRASPYDIVDALYPIRSMAGVNSVEVLAATEGNPEYCVVVDLDDAQDALFATRLESVGREYAGYYSNLSTRAFRKIG